MSVLSHRFQQSLHMAVVCLLCVVILVACGRTRPAQAPPVAGSLPPIIDIRPDEAEPMPQTVQPRNIRRIHDRLFHDAQHHFQAKNFTQAIQEFTRLLALHPETDLEREGHWWLGQSYDQLEDWKSAQREYRKLASAPIGQQYQSNSSQRLQEIQGLLEQRELPPKHTQAIRFALHQLPRADGFDQGITKMKQDGATTLLIDLGCKRVSLTHASAKRAEAIPGIEELQGLLRLYAERSHHAGLLLYVGVNLRCLGHWAPSTHQVWRDQMYQVDTGRVSPTQQFDLFHPAYQEFLARFLSRLCKEEVDGLVLLNDHPLGLFEGVTPIGVKRFEKQFGVAFDPSRIFYQGFDPLGDSKKYTRIVTHERFIVLAMGGVEGP